MRVTIEEKIETETSEQLLARVAAIQERRMKLEIERALLLFHLSRPALMAPAWFRELL